MRIIFTLTFFVALAASAKPIRIAALYSTSSRPLAHFGYGIEASCMTKAVVEDAKKQGVPLSLDFFDLQNTPVSTALAAKKVVSQSYDVAVGTLISAEAIAASRIFEAARVPFITPTATHPEVTEGKKFVARLPFNDRRQAELLAKLTVRELKPQVVAVIRNLSNPYSDFLGREYMKNLKSQAPWITVHDFPIVDGVNEIERLVPKVLGAKANLIFVPLLQSSVASIYSELAKRKASMTILGSDIVESDVNFTEVLGKTSPAIKFIFVQHWNRKYDGTLGSRYRALHTKYCAQYKPSMVMVAVFDAMTLLVETVKKHPNWSKENLIDLYKGARFTGLTGPMIYDADGNVQKPLQLFTVERNRTVFWKEFE